MSSIASGINPDNNAAMKDSEKQPTTHDEHTDPHPTTTSSTASNTRSDTLPTIHSYDETLAYASQPPPLHYTLRTTRRVRWISIFFVLLFIDSGLLPLILFYSLEWGAHLSTTKNLAIITSLVGTTSGCKIAQRTYLLWFHRDCENRRPIGTGRWGVDAFQYVCPLMSHSRTLTSCQRANITRPSRLPSTPHRRLVSKSRFASNGRHVPTSRNAHVQRPAPCHWSL